MNFRFTGRVNSSTSCFPDVPWSVSRRKTFLLSVINSFRASGRHNLTVAPDATPY